MEWQAKQHVVNIHFQMTSDSAQNATKVAKSMHNIIRQLCQLVW